MASKESSDGIGGGGHLFPAHAAAAALTRLQIRREHMSGNQAQGFLDGSRGFRSRLDPGSRALTQVSSLLGLTGTAHAQPQESLPNMLWRVAPSIVQVHGGGLMTGYRCVSI